MSQEPKPGGAWPLLIFGICFMIACAVAYGIYMVWFQP
jgi:hypothetical protein